MSYAETQDTPTGYDGFWECKADPTHDTRAYTVCDDCAELIERKRGLQAKDWPETPADTLTNKLLSLTESQQRRALNFLWGTMTIRDPQACIDAMAWVANIGDER